MRIPVFLAVAQWALLLALSLLVIMMYRQLAQVFGQKKPSTGHGPPVGSKAAAIEYRRLSDDTPRYLTPDGVPTLVAFVEPSCLACDQLVAAITATDDAGALAGVRVLLLMSDPPKYIRVSDAFRSTRQEIGRVMTQATVDACNATATPLLVAIDTSGLVQASGAAHDISDVRSYIGACLLPSLDSTLPVVDGAAAENPAQPDATVAAARSNTNQGE